MVIGSSLSLLHIDQSKFKTTEPYNDGRGMVAVQEIVELGLDAALFACCGLHV